MLQFSLSSLLPIQDKDKLSKYFRYNGSLTTPPCSENVIWTIFDHKLKISLTQVIVYKQKINFIIEVFFLRCTKLFILIGQIQILEKRNGLTIAKFTQATV